MASPPSQSHGSRQPIELKNDTLPSWLRFRIWASRFLYPGRNRGGNRSNIVRLPFGKVAKLWTTINELEAMEYVRQHTSIPIPKLYEAYRHKNGTISLVMEGLPGNGSDYARMGQREVEAFGRELSGYILQLRSLEPPEAGYIGSVTGGPLVDHRVGHVPFGPFHSVPNFHFYLRLGGRLQDWTKGEVVKRVHGESHNYKVKFTHPDLNPRNIQYYKGRIVGIIDWEFAGWYPEYWEYTKMLWADVPNYKPFFRAVEGEPSIKKYHEEIEAKRDIWRLISHWRYDDYYGEQEKRDAVYAALGEDVARKASMQQALQTT